MSGTSGTAPPIVVLGSAGSWYHRRRALVQTVPLHVAGEGRGKTPLRLPSLVTSARGPGQRHGVPARLSLSEPSLFTPQDGNLCEGFSSSDPSCVSLRRPPPPPPFCRLRAACPPRGTSHSHLKQKHQHHPRQISSSGPAYIHFSQAIQPTSKPKPARPHSHSLTRFSEMRPADLQPLGMQICNSQLEHLSVIGKPYPLHCSQRPVMAAAAGPGRPQLHVFLPTEVEEEEVDSESVDEGFMDELDSMITHLKLQQEALKSARRH